MLTDVTTSKTLEAVALILALGVIACQGGPRDAEALRVEAEEEIRSILELDRRAHMETDAGLLVQHLADTLVSVANGEVQLETREQAAAFFASYFEGAVYHAWDDLMPPLVRISADAQAAWVIRKVRVDREAPADDGGMRRREFVAAWIATYERRGDDWRMTSVASTFAPLE